ncbi:MAG: hypothetical protein EBR15_01120 [Gammaproteobacteria bacterium]|nr:hypothetical protein [Gammaproteobacteria bacterium]
MPAFASRSIYDVLPNHVSVHFMSHLTSRERQLGLLTACTAVFTLAGYEALRSSATILLKSAYGPDVLAPAMTTTPLVILLGLWIYGKLLSALGPRRTAVATSLGFAALIVSAYVAVELELRPATLVLYWLKEFYIVLLIEQYWSYLNSSLSPFAARRLNGPITGVAGFGSMIGGYFVSIAALPMGTAAMVLVGGLTLLPAAWLINQTYRRFGEVDASKPALGLRGAGIGANLLRSEPQLRALLAIVLATQMISSLLELNFQQLSSLAFEGRRDAETAFQGQFWSYLNGAALLSQFLLTPLLLTRFSLRQAHLLIPVVQLGAIGWALTEPSLYSVGLAFMAFKVFDYSLFRGAKELIYLPLSFDGRYRTKELIDVFGYRTGKAVSSLGVTLLQRFGVELSSLYLPVAFSFCAVWCGLVFPLTERRTDENQTPENLRPPDETDNV